MKTLIYTLLLAAAPLSANTYLYDEDIEAIELSLDRMEIVAGTLPFSDQTLLMMDIHNIRYTLELHKLEETCSY